MLSVLGFIFHEIEEYEKHKICVLDFVRHRGITLILFGRFVIQLVCLLDGYLFIRNASVRRSCVVEFSRTIKA